MFIGIFINDQCFLLTALESVNIVMHDVYVAVMLTWSVEM